MLFCSDFLSGHNMQTTPFTHSNVSNTESSDPVAATMPGVDPALFVDRRERSEDPAGVERRQFASSHHGLSPEARELAMAIDSYKLEHRRRYVTFEEMLQVISQLGYRKETSEK